MSVEYFVALIIAGCVSIVFSVLVLGFVLIRMQHSHDKQVNLLHQHYMHEMRTQNLFIMSGTSQEYAAATGRIISEETKKRIAMGGRTVHGAMDARFGRVPEV